MVEYYYFIFVPLVTNWSFSVSSSRYILWIKDSQNGEKTTVSMMEFLTEVDMSDKVIVAVLLPSLADNVVYRSFKVKPRSQVSWYI